MKFRLSLFVCLFAILLGPSLTEGRTLRIKFQDLKLDAGTPRMVGTQTIAKAGSPLLPIRSLRILLPPGTSAEDIKIHVKMEGLHRINLEVPPAPAQRPIGIRSPDLPTKADPAIYERDALYPGTNYHIAGLTMSHGYEILLLEVYPVRWNPVQGEAWIATSAKIVIATGANSAKRRRPDPNFRGLTRDAEEVSLLVDNPLDIRDYPPSKSSSSRDDWEYLIVTSASMLSTFQNLADHRASVDGMSTHIETMDTITSSYSGRDDAEKLRNFVIDAYTNHNTRYLLLGGDADVVPTRGCYGRAEVSYTDNSIPTDFYFGALDGDWNADGDGIWGEPEDNVDLLAEVSVGRISAGNTTEAQQQIDKIIAYETWSTAPHSSLMLGEQADAVSYGGDMLDYLSLQMADTNLDKLYDRDGSWSPSTLINSYLDSDTVNTINHMGHANETYVMKLDPSDVTALTNTHPFFIYSQGCYAGAFDQTDCMAEYFTAKSTGAAHAVIMNSRYGWYTPNSVFGSSNIFQREFLQAMHEEHVTRLGDANTLSKNRLAGLAEVYGSMRWVFFELTLFGDPATPIHWQCSDSSLHITPESPEENGFHIMQGDDWILKAAVHTDCSGAVTDYEPVSIQASFNNGDSPVTLRDDGVGPDETAGDGHYSGLWTPQHEGPVQISFLAQATGLDDASTSLSGEIVPWMNYIQASSTSPWIDTSGGEFLSSGDLLSNSDDGGWLVSVGFPFSLYGVSYADMMVGTNGLIQMEHGTSYSSTEESFPLPYDGDDNGIIAPWWCDLNPGTSGSLRILREGASPHRSLTIEWHEVPHFDHVGAITFQATLYEGTNEIIFRYQDTSFGDSDYDHGADASVGIEGPNGVHGIQAHYHDGAITDGEAILFSPISSTGRLSFDHPVYACTSQPVIQLEDADLSGESSISVQVHSDTETDPLSVQLTPGSDPRIFNGSFPTAEGAPIADTNLEVSDGDTITVEYVDANPPGSRTAEARIDCRPPDLSALNVSDIGARSAIVHWSSDEYADSQTSATPGGATASDATLVETHELLLEGLEACTSYTVMVSSADGAGNSSSLGPSALFTTLDSVMPVDDDVESGNTGWTVDTVTDPGAGTDWSIITDASAASPTHSWFSSDEGDDKEDLLIGGPYQLGPGQSTLSFQHHFNFESNWDGGVLEISTDGSNWNDILNTSATFTTGAYTGAINSSALSPLSDRDAWTGDSGGLMETRVDLSTYSGTQIWIRFRLACDSSLGADGWYLDDIQMESTTQCSASDLVFSDGFENAGTSRWSWATN